MPLHPLSTPLEAVPRSLFKDVLNALNACYGSAASYQSLVQDVQSLCMAQDQVMTTQVAVYCLS